MDMGLIGGLAFSYALHEGCTQTCDFDLQSFILMCVIVLVAALGARYMIRHSGDPIFDSHPSTSIEKQSKSLH